MVMELVAEVQTSSIRNPPFTVSVRVESETAIVAVGGELDLATAPILDEHLELFKGHVDAVVFQLADLTFIDAFGLRTLLAYETSPGQGVSMRTPSCQARRLLEIVDLESIIDDSPTTLYA